MKAAKLFLLVFVTFLFSNGGVYCFAGKGTSGEGCCEDAQVEQEDSVDVKTEEDNQPEKKVILEAKNETTPEGDEEGEDDEEEKEKFNYEEFKKFAKNLKETEGDKKAA